jgi:hypothetical protein
VTDGGGERHRSRAEAAVSGEGGVRVEQRNARERALTVVSVTLGWTEPVG